MPTADGQLTAAEVAQIVALVQAQALLREQLTATAVAGVTAPLRVFTKFWSAAAINTYLDTVMKVVRPAQTRMARTTDAYLARVMTIMAGRRVDPVGAVDVSKLRRAISPAQATAIAAALPAGYDYAPSQRVTTTSNQTSSTATTATVSAAPTTNAAAPATVDPRQVYGRIFDSARFYAASRNLSIPQLQTRSVARAAHVAATDIMLADRAQSRQTMRARGVQRYRRVIRPYAGQGGPVCGLCIVASDRIYTIEDLLPIHGNCRCEVVPVGSAQDPGKTLNDEDLATLYAAAGSTGGRQLKTVRVTISEHGELGPILSYGNHNKRGVTEVAAATSTDRQTVARAQLASYEKSIIALREQDAAGKDVTKALTWQSDKIAALRAELGVS
ncbi:MAG: hypothetical protein ABWY93_18790 [Mycobacterium sp.]